MKVAVIVNDMSELNIDAQLVEDGDAKLSRTEEELVEMSNGCICCTLREDLLEEVSRLSKQGRFDYLIIESTGISEPLPVAQTFTFRDAEGTSLGDVARLDTCVTMVDAANFLDDYRSSDALADLEMAADDTDNRTLSNLLVDQVEFADVLIINIVDQADEETLERLEGVLTKLNPRAKLLRSEYSRVPLESVVGTERFDMDEAIEAPGWVQELEGNATPETEEYGVSSFVYRSRRPFHPARLVARLSTPWEGVIRSKGYLWVATRMEQALSWSQAGSTTELALAGSWWAASDRSEWPADPEILTTIQENMAEPYGDRRQELVVIGMDMDEQALRHSFNRCLLSDEEMDAGPEGWADFEDPLPNWSIPAEMPGAAE